jgi:hypothetical protein
MASSLQMSSAGCSSLARPFLDSDAVIAAARRRAQGIVATGPSPSAAQRAKKDLEALRNVFCDHIWGVGGSGWGHAQRAAAGWAADVEDELRLGAECAKSESRARGP